MYCWITWFREKDPKLRRAIRDMALMLGVIENLGWVGFVHAMLGIFG